MEAVTEARKKTDPERGKRMHYIRRNLSEDILTLEQMAEKIQSTAHRLGFIEFKLTYSNVRHYEDGVNLNPIVCIALVELGVNLNWLYANKQEPWTELRSTKKALSFIS